jgi:hypothetical protein
MGRPAFEVRRTMARRGYVSTGEAAALAHRHPNTIRNWCLTGAVKFKRCEGAFFVSLESLRARAEFTW